MEMNELQIFTNNGFDLHTIERDGDIWFLASEVTDAMGYANSRKAIKDHVDDDEKSTVTIRYGTDGNPNRTVINESGFYHLAFSSKKAEAVQFRKWVTSEVLPSIRKHGAYITQELLADNEALEKVVKKLRREVKLISDIRKSKTEWSVEDLTTHFINMGFDVTMDKEMRAILEEHKWIKKNPQGEWQPTAAVRKKKWCTVKPAPWKCKGTLVPYMQVVITVDGLCELTDLMTEWGY